MPLLRTLIAVLAFLLLPAVASAQAPDSLDAHRPRLCPAPARDRRARRRLCRRLLRAAGMARGGDAPIRAACPSSPPPPRALQAPAGGDAGVGAAAPRGAPQAFLAAQLTAAATRLRMVAGREAELRRGGAAAFTASARAASRSPTTIRCSPGSSGWCRATGRSPTRVEAFRTASSSRATGSTR